MVHFFDRLFNIRTQEWPRLLFLYAILFLIVTGCTWGKTIVEASFLQLIGVQYLPWVLMASSAMSLFAVIVYSAFADRTTDDRTLIAVLGVSVVAILVGVILLGLGYVIIAIPLLYLLYFVVLVDVFNLHWGTYVNGFYDVRSAKRTIPLIGAATRVAGIVGGLTMPVLNHFLPPAGIITIWAAMLGSAGFLVWRLPRLVTGDTPAPMPRAATHSSYVDNAREGYRFVRGSGFLRWMAVSTLLLMLLLAFINYQTSRVLVAKFGTSQAIADFTGLVTGLSNLIILPIQLFWLSRLFNRIGLGNASLIFPAATLPITGSLIFFPSALTAALGYFDRTTFRVSFQYTVDSLLYNAVPRRIKGRARAFIGGLLVPVGSLVGAGLLLLPMTTTTAWYLPALLGLAAIGYLVSAVFVRQSYGQALIDTLEQHDFSTLVPEEAGDLTVSDPAVIAGVRSRLDSSRDPETTVFLAQLLSQLDEDGSVAVLADKARSTEDPRIRSAMLEVLQAASARGVPVRELYIELTTDPDAQVRGSALAGFATVVSPGYDGLLERASEMLRDPSLAVRTQAFGILLRSPISSYRRRGRDAVEHLLASDDPEERALGARALADTGDRLFSVDLLTALGDPDDKVRLEAALALEKQADGPLREQVVELLQWGTALSRIEKLTQDPVERVRRAALSVLGISGNDERWPVLASALADPSRQVREAAADQLVQAGRVAIPVVNAQLNSSSSAARATAAVTLARINRRDFSGLVPPQITAQLLEIYRSLGYVEALQSYAGHPAVALLQRALGDSGQDRTSEIFYLLGGIHDPAMVSMIVESLRNESDLVRANATEALESWTSPQTAQMCTALLAPGLTSAQRLRLAEENWDVPSSGALTALQQMAVDPDPWLRAMAIAAAGEIAAEQASTPANAGTKRTRGKGRADGLESLLGAPASRRRGAAAAVLSRADAEAMLDKAVTDPADEVRAAASTARRILAGTPLLQAVREEHGMLSPIEKTILLQEVPFFQGLTVAQLQGLARVAEEQSFEPEAVIFKAGDPGGALYMVVEGRVAIEQERRAGSVARLATIEAHSYFGEQNFFDETPRNASAVALQETLILRLRREPLIALARQNPDLSLELIGVLSKHLGEAMDRIADLTRARPRELNKLFDQYG